MVMQPFDPGGTPAVPGGWQAWEPWDAVEWLGSVGGGIIGGFMGKSPASATTGAIVGSELGAAAARYFRGAEGTSGMQLTAPGTVHPVTLVKVWKAGLATFAIDNEGRRWAFRNKLGIWKRVPVRRNIVISGKDILRAKRLIRKSRQLQTIRHELGLYSAKRKRKR